MTLRLIIIIAASQILMYSCGIIRNKMTVKNFNQVDLKNDRVYSSPIIWSLDTADNGDVKKNAMYLPINIQGVDQKLKMQFDLGSNTSIFYLKTIYALGQDNPEILKNLAFNKDRYSYLNAVITLNEGTILHSYRIPILRNFGENTLSPNLPVFGTLGYDIIGDNILIIDFVSDSISIVGKLTSEMEKMAIFIKDTDLEKFPVILPFVIGNKKVRLLYDTGSSSFQILTGTKRVKKISKNGELVLADSAYSWGDKIYFYRAKVPKQKENLFLGPYDLGQVDIIGTDKLNPLSLSGKYLYGILGNEIFNNAILIIDRKNNRFGIVKKITAATNKGKRGFLNIN